MEATSHADFMKWKAPPIVNIVGNDHLLTDTSFNVLYGPTGIYKSHMVNHLAHCIAYGKPWLAFPTTKNMVWVIQLELSKPMWQKRIRKYMKGHGLIAPCANILLSTEHYLKLDSPAGGQQIVSIINQHPDIRVVIIDPILPTISGKISDSQDVSKFMDNMLALKFDHGLAVIIVCHTRKAHSTLKGEKVDFGVEEILGSMQFSAMTNTVIGMRPTGGEDNLLLTFDKTRDSENKYPMMKLHFDRNTCGFKVI